MAQFNISDTADKSKVFLVKRSELTERFDATSYKLVFNFKTNRFPIYRLSEIAFINPTTNFNKLNNDDEISFVPMEAVSDKNGVIKKYQTKKVKESKGFTRFKDNDLIWAKITPCMQNGKSAVVKNTINGYACGSTEFFIIRPKTNNLLIEYVHFLLRDKRVLDNAQNFFGGSAGQQRVSKDFLLNFKIPLPPTEIQQQIVEKINFAYTQKQQKEAEAKALLSSIDTYLLNELGITLPEKDTSLKSRIFTTMFSEVSGGRFDPDYNKIFYTNFINQLSKKYESKKLINISDSIFQGVGRELTENNKITLLKVKNIKKGNLIDFEDVEFVKSTPTNKILQKNDIISPFIGEAIKQIKFSVFNNLENKYTIDNNTGVIRVNNSYNSNYIAEILNSKIGEIQILKLIGGGGVPFLGSRNVSKIEIPLPPIEKQTEISNHIQALRSQAKQLQEEAKAVLEEAKKEVEKMILGE